MNEKGEGTVSFLLTLKSVGVCHNLTGLNSVLPASCLVGFFFSSLICTSDLNLEVND